MFDKSNDLGDITKKTIKFDNVELHVLQNTTLKLYMVNNIFVNLILDQHTFDIRGPFVEMTEPNCIVSAAIFEYLCSDHLII
jgi:hypothetical protein